jgi:hypothetical protein
LLQSKRLTTNKHPHKIRRKYEIQRTMTKTTEFSIFNIARSVEQIEVTIDSNQRKTDFQFNRKKVSPT